MGFRVEVEKMREDASKWDRYSTQMGTAVTSIDTGGADNAEFSLLGFEVSAEHTTANTRLSELVTAGQTYFADVAEALRATANHYEQTDEQEGRRPGETEAGR